MSIRSKVSHLCPPTGIFVADRTYKQPSLQELEDLLFLTYFEEYKWTKEVFDCDDFADILAAYVKQNRYKEHAKLPWSFGICWGSVRQHALNIAVTNNDKVYLIEPQNDEIWEATGAEGLYLIKI